jgi:hypothetical protein
MHGRYSARKQRYSSSVRTTRSRVSNSAIAPLSCTQIHWSSIPSTTSTNQPTEPRSYAGCWPSHWAGVVTHTIAFTPLLGLSTRWIVLDQRLSEPTYETKKLCDVDRLKPAPRAKSKPRKVTTQESAHLRDERERHADERKEIDR